MLQRHQLCPGGLTAQREALNDPQQNEQDRCPNADLSISRQQAHQYRCQTHQGHGSQHQIATAQFVTEVTTRNRAQWTGGQANAKRCQRGEQASGRLHGREKQLGQNGRRHRAIQREVKPLQSGTNGRGGHRFARHARIMSLVTGCAH
ncbi:hypothetical protein D3C80_1423030 [compost metagenome]